MNINVNYTGYGNFGMGFMPQVYGNSYNYGFGNMQQMQMQQMMIMQMMMQMQTMQMIQQMGGQAWRMNGPGEIQQMPPFPNMASKNVENKNQVPAVQENKANEAKKAKPEEKSESILGKISGMAGTKVGQGIGTAIGGAIGGPIGSVVGNVAGGVIGKVASGIIEKVGGKVVDGAKSIFSKIGSFFGF